MAAALHPADIIEAATAVLATIAYYASLALHARRHGTRPDRP